MESNKRAIIILLSLVTAAVLAFRVEKKFLIRENRGSTLSQYEAIPKVNDIMLLIEDFEGLSNSDSTVVPDSIFKKNGFFNYGSAKISIDHSKVDHDLMASKSDLMIEWSGDDKYGGWGKGVGANIEFDPETEYVNFRVYFPVTDLKTERIKLIITEDDNEDAILEADQDDEWSCKVNIQEKEEWQLISVPLKNFTDDNKGGDGIFNITRRGGLHTFTFVLDQPDDYVQGQKWYLDFVTISHEPLNNNITSLK